MKKIFIVAGILFLSACKSNEDKPAETSIATTQSAKSLNSEGFNQQFKTTLDEYYMLKDQFVAENDSAIATSSRKLKILVDSLSLEGISGDSVIKATAKTYINGISSELLGLLGEKDREEKRKAFQMVGEQFYDLIRTVQYDKEVVYHQYCPMAFNDQGATWLSNSSDIRNPYLPKKMLTCGEVKDSIDLRSK
jgi:Protein of unknown function (DUF3347)